MPRWSLPSAAGLRRSIPFPLSSGLELRASVGEPTLMTQREDGAMGTQGHLRSKLPTYTLGCCLPLDCGGTGQQISEP